jgi:hypothetical protein
MHAGRACCATDVSRPVQNFDFDPPVLPVNQVAEDRQSIRQDKFT